MGSLPKALKALGNDARLIMPLYKSIKERYSTALQFRRWSMTKLGWRTMYNGLFSMEVDGVTCYFIDNEYYFGYEALYVEYGFDIERFAFFQRAVLEVLGEPMDFHPDILHLNDWQTGMIPVLLEAHYKHQGFHQDVHCVYTIHNLKFQGIHGRETVQDLLSLQDHYFSESAVMKDGVPNFMKAGIMYANRVTTVSPSYAEEIMSDYFGEGLNGILGAQSWKLSGILNGIDMEGYNPKTDRTLAANYGLYNWRKGKAQNKLALQKQLGLPEDGDKVVLSMVSRLAEQKGVDLLLHIMEELLEEEVQVVILGTGEPHYEEALRAFEERYPEKFRALITFSDVLSRKIYAASDLFMMPSLFEPCGLSQMISMRYGTLPVVRETGGLKDTVQAYNKYDGSGNGFSFAHINAHELLFALKEAIHLHQLNQKAFGRVVRTAMQEDFSWDRSAKTYLALYEAILEENKR